MIAQLLQVRLDLFDLFHFLHSLIVLLCLDLFGLFSHEFADLVTFQIIWILLFGRLTIFDCFRASILMANINVCYRVWERWIIGCNDAWVDQFKLLVFARLPLSLKQTVRFILVAVLIPLALPLSFIQILSRNFQTLIIFDSKPKFFRFSIDSAQLARYLLPNINKVHACWTAVVEFAINNSHYWRSRFLLLLDCAVSSFFKILNHREARFKALFATTL